MNKKEPTLPITNMIETPFVVMPPPFPSDFLLECLKCADHLPEEQARTGMHMETDEEGIPGKADPKIRQNIIKWIRPQMQGGSERETMIWSTVDNVCNQVAREYFGFDTWMGGTEGIQYTEYNYNEESEIKDHYGWHMDSTIKTPMVFDRKISFSLQLTADDEYTGCDLELGNNFMNDELKSAMRERGTLILFPSFLAHRVTPITGGTRKALVGWCRGPKFR